MDTSIQNPASFDLRVIHCPTPEEKRTDLSLPILNTASYSWSIITPPLEVRKRNPGHFYPKSSLILRVIHCPTLEVKRRDLNLPILNTASYSWSIITPPPPPPPPPFQEQKNADPGFPILEPTF